MSQEKELSVMCKFCINNSSAFLSPAKHPFSFHPFSPLPPPILHYSFCFTFRCAQQRSVSLLPGLTHHQLSLETSLQYCIRIHVDQNSTKVKDSSLLFDISSFHTQKFLLELSTHTQCSAFSALIASRSGLVVTTGFFTCHMLMKHTSLFQWSNTSTKIRHSIAMLVRVRWDR